MAILKFGAIVTDGRGKLGGVSILKTRYGHIIKRNGIRKTTPGKNSVVIKSRTAYLSKQWSTLTNEQRQLWQNQVKDYPYFDVFGDIKYLSSFFLFQKINQGRLATNQSLLLIPNSVDKPAIPTFLNVYLTTSSIILQSSAIPTNTFVQIYATQYLSKGISNANKYLRLIATITGNDLIHTIDVINNYLEVFPDLQIGQQIFVAQKTISEISGYGSKNILVNLPSIVQPVTDFNYVFQNGSNYQFQNGDNYRFN